MAVKYEYDTDENERESSGAGKKLGFLLVGGGIGAALALLLAPKSGRELRGDIADATRKGIDKSRETATTLRDQSGARLQQIKEQAGSKLRRQPNRQAENALELEKARTEAADNVSLEFESSDADENLLSSR